MIYFDNSATTQTLPEAAKRACTAMTNDYFNPAAAYGAAFSVEKTVTEARSFASSLLGVSPAELIYTSGGTESNNAVVFGTLRGLRGKPFIVTTAIEHPSVYETVNVAAKMFDATVLYAPLCPDGTVDVDRLSEVLSSETSLVSIMHVNNELGSVNNLDRIAAKVRALSPNAIIHSDGVQAFMKVRTGKVPVDLYSVSAHKLHAPKGVGFLYVKNGVRFSGGQIGGGQERNLRSGTTNVPGILGFDTALRAYQANEAAWRAQMLRVKTRLYRNLMALPDVLLNGPSVETGAPHILNCSFLGVRGEVLMHALERCEILVSTGSACSSKKQGKNRILNAVGITGARQEGAIRFSFSPFNTEDEADAAANAIEGQLRILRRYQRR
ncbi:MAG: cysteine desulfurase [Clostridia bacterium]|nr:cysteine desulfurase [Clostridia bacterium]